MMDKRAIALLETALRTTTNEGERNNALSLFRGIVDKAGGLEKMVASPVTQPTRAYVPYSQTKGEITRLEGEVRDRDARIETLECEHARLTKENATLKAQNETLVAAGRKSLRVSDDGTMPYNEWARIACGRLGSYRNWQQAFEDQTGLPKGRIQTFRARGFVEIDYVEAIHKLVPITPLTRYKEGWSLPEVRRLRQLVDAGHTEKDIAKLLTAELHRVITEGMIKRVKLDSRSRKGVFANPAFGPEIGKSRK